MRLRQNDNQCLILIPRVCTILRCELNTNHIGINETATLQDSVTFSKIVCLTCSVYVNAFILFFLGFEHFRSINKSLCFAVMYIPKRNQLIFTERLANTLVSSTRNIDLPIR